MTMLHWSDGSGRLNPRISEEDANTGYHTGDCEAEVRALMALPDIAEQVQAWPLEHLKDNLREYGAWSEEELADEDMTRVRTLWPAETSWKILAFTGSNPQCNTAFVACSNPLLRGR